MKRLAASGMLVAVLGIGAAGAVSTPVSAVDTPDPQSGACYEQIAQMKYERTVVEYGDVIEKETRTKSRKKEWDSNKHRLVWGEWSAYSAWTDWPGAGPVNDDGRARGPLKHGEHKGALLHWYREYRYVVVGQYEKGSSLEQSGWVTQPPAGEGWVKVGDQTVDGNQIPCPQPPPETEYGEWTGTPECGDETYEQTRTKTTTPYVLNGFDWVPGTPVVEVENQTVQVDEVEPCPIPEQPDDKVEYSEWVDGDSECGDTTVEQTRTKTTTSYVWVGPEAQTPGSWVLDTENSTTETETQIRDLTEDEIEPCPTPEKPDEKVEYSEWVDGEWECDDTTVEQTRTKTTTAYVLVDGGWVLDTENATTETETRIRDLTEDEVEPCPTPNTEPPAAPQPEPEPAEEPATTEPEPEAVMLPTSGEAPTPDPAPAAPTPDPVTVELPQTGSSETTIALLALLFTIGGASILTVTRRRGTDAV